MTNIVIDPLIVMTPSDNATREEVVTWFGNLSAWLNEALTAPFIWLHYLQASHLLQEYGRFPEFGELKRLQKRYQLDINISQIAHHINDFFRNEDLDLADHIDRLDFIIELATHSILVQPTQFITRLPHYLHNDFHILLANCCACKHIALPPGEKLHIATLALPDSIRAITISAIIQAAIPDSLFKDGSAIIQTFPLIITPDDLPDSNEIIDIWSQGEARIIYTIKKQAQKEQATTRKKTFAFRLGPSFIRSINERGLDTNEIILRSIIRAIVNVIFDRARDVKGYSLHEFRVSETPDSPQLERASDKGKAWRLKLRQSGAGWRLHYWQIPTTEGAMIEFANVGKESEREIY